MPVDPLEVVMVAGGPLTGTTFTTTGVDVPEHPDASNAVTEYEPEVDTTIDELVCPPGFH
jgi:hypothetical protein